LHWTKGRQILHHLWWQETLPIGETPVPAGLAQGLAPSLCQVLERSDALQQQLATHKNKTNAA
jgi:hypothetical protein